MEKTEYRIASVNPERCRPQHCAQECRKICPVVKMGRQCVEVTKESKIATISEVQCNGCGQCVKRCPFDAIRIIRLPTALKVDTAHQYGPNSFKLHRLPIPRLGKVLGLIGKNGVGKTTALKILAGKVKPNLGNFENPPEWQEIIKTYRGSELQNYLTKLTEEKIATSVKPQHVELLAKTAPEKTVRELIDEKAQLDNRDKIIALLEIGHLLDHPLKALAGGELQRVTIACVCMRNADLYFFDEPCSFLDVKQRLNAAKAIRSLVSMDKYVIVVEHDLSVLDFICNQVCLLYGEPSAYGVVTKPSGVREGINIYLDGYIPTENMRFRAEPLNFQIADTVEQVTNVEEEKKHYIPYPSMKKTVGSFALEVEEGNFTGSEIIVLFGQNGTGKSTFIKLLAGKLKPDETAVDFSMVVSYKPQLLATESKMTVSELLNKRAGANWQSVAFGNEVVKPLSLNPLLTHRLCELSGGELQRVAIAVCLAQEADLYLLDEPSNFLDVEQRVLIAKVLKRFMRNHKKTAFIVEHDLILATYLADRVVLFNGTPSVQTKATAPLAVEKSLEAFLKTLDITMRTDKTSGRPRINKPGSFRDREQKRQGTWYLARHAQPRDLGVEQMS
jgi:ATP-binding cassette subfamily E protein 1